MLPASNRGPGMSLGFPDVCLTPSPAGPVPVPYPNIAMNAQAAPFSASVKVNMMNALNERGRSGQRPPDGEAGAALHDG
jgi:carboxyl-terminal processing protease